MSTKTGPNRILTTIFILVLASLSCQAVANGAPLTQAPVATDSPSSFSTLSAPTQSGSTTLTAPTNLPSVTNTPFSLTSEPQFQRPTNEAYVAPDQSGLDLNCDGTRTDVPCEPRKIRIRGFDNPLSDGAPVQGQSYGWFPIAENIPWIIAVHTGVGPQGFPVGYAFDAGTLMQFDHEENGYYYVIHPDFPGILFTLSTAEVTSQKKPTAAFFMKNVPAKWCPVNPSDGTSTMITVGDTYTWFGLGYHVQFNYLERYPNAEALMQSGTDPDIMANNGELVPVQDFTPMEFVITTATRKPWVKYNGELMFAPNSFCNYWQDTAQ